MTLPLVLEMLEKDRGVLLEERFDFSVAGLAVDFTKRSCKIAFAERGRRRKQLDLVGENSIQRETR